MTHNGPTAEAMAALALTREGFDVALPVFAAQLRQDQQVGQRAPRHSGQDRLR